MLSCFLFYVTKVQYILHTTTILCSLRAQFGVVTTSSVQFV